MKMLALDLSTRQGSVALADEGQLLFDHSWANDRRSAAPFFETLERVTKEFGHAEMIIVGLGPGSYTGTRIAISTAVGLALTCGASLVGLDSIAALGTERNFDVIGDAKRATFFLAKVRERRLDHAPELFAAEQLEERLDAYPVFTSDALPQFPRATLRFPQARILLETARLNPQNLLRAPLTPIYLREPYITK